MFQKTIKSSDLEVNLKTSLTSTNLMDCSEQVPPMTIHTFNSSSSIHSNKMEILKDTQSCGATELQIQTKFSNPNQPTPILTQQQQPPLQQSAVLPAVIPKVSSPPSSSSTSSLNNSNTLQVLNNNNNNSNTSSSNIKTSNLNMNQFIDPLEHSLASLEQPQVNMQKSQDLNSMLMDFQKQQQQLQLNLINQMPTHVPHVSNTSTNFGSDFNGVNGLINILGIQSVDSTNLQMLNSNLQMKPPPTGRFPEVWNASNTTPLPPLPIATTLPSRNSWEQQQQQQQHHQHQQQSQQHQQSVLKQDSKIMLTPKPIEELLADKSKIINPSTTTDVRVNTAFGQTFKYEQNLKNANSWSQLASVESLNTASKSKLPSDTFQEFRTKAKEQQQQRQKQEAEKMKRQLKEQEMKRQQESLQKQTKVEDSNNGQRLKAKMQIKINKKKFNFTNKIPFIIFQKITK